jgi:23S rRNA (cytidine1920-2'-O)/16S rRNA (cytidine1409-2'-O)-methyltransferase
VHDAVTKTIHEFATQTLGLMLLGVIPSPLLGPAGNKEFLIALRKP